MYKINDGGLCLFCIILLYFEIHVSMEKEGVLICGLDVTTTACFTTAYCTAVHNNGCVEFAFILYDLLGGPIHMEM